MLFMYLTLLCKCVGYFVSNSVVILMGEKICLRNGAIVFSVVEIRAKVILVGGLNS